MDPVTLLRRRFGAHRCTRRRAWIRSAPHPVGTLLVVEIAGPWPRDISEAPPFSGLCQAPSATIEGADGRVWRPQGVVPVGPGTTVISYERSVAEGRRTGPFRRREWLLPEDRSDSLADLCRVLIEADEDAIAGFEIMRNDPPEATVDLLLCTHGTRDVCCGGSGTALYGQLSGIGQPDSSDRAPATSGARVWRSSHAGGHRFAPTAISLPEGVSWSHLDATSATAVLRRADSCDALAGHVRGALTLPEPTAQVADREGFHRHGWQWFSTERTATLLDPSTPVWGSAGSDDGNHDGARAGTVPAVRSETWSVAAELDAGGRGCVAVELAGRVPRPPCRTTPVDPTDISTAAADVEPVDTDDVWRVAAAHWDGASPGPSRTRL
ncbi:MAG: sucrase ferredoxin [Microthrixaceae bacterium]